MFKRIIILFFLLQLCLTGYTQHISRLGVESGLNGLQAFNIVQDKKGFLWISTRFGIDRFDGANIKNYEMDILHNSTIPIRSIRVVLDADSMLWAYTDRGTIYQYNNLRDEFRVYLDLDMYIRNMYIDNNNKIWITTTHAIGFIHEGRVEYVKERTDNESFMAAQEYDEENLLLVSKNNIYKYNKTNSNIHTFLAPEDVAKEKMSIETCYYDRNAHKLWIGSDHDGFFFFDLLTNTLSKVSDSRLNNHLIRSINQLNEDYILFGTEGLGACLLNTQTYKIEKIYNQRSDYHSRISDDVIYDIFKDSSGRIWLSCYSGGINILDYTERGFRTITHEENNENSLSRNTVYDILEDSDNNLWFATNNDLSHWNRKTNKWKTLLPSKNILTLYEDSHGQIWVGTFSSGVYVLSKEGAILKNYTRSPHSANTLAAHFIYTITEDSEGMMWFGGKRGRISRLNPATNEFTEIIGVSQVNNIIQQDKDRMLISSESGVYQAELKGSVATPCLFNDSLKSRYISDICMETDSVVWLATYGDGLNRCNVYTGEITRYTITDGLPSNIIHAFEFNDNGNLWFSSENGIGCFNLQSHEVTNYSIDDGIAGNRSRQMSKAKSRDGTLYFGSYNGVTCFNPDEIAKQIGHATLSLENFWLFNQVIKPGDKHSPLKESLDNTRQIKLSYKQHSFSISFAAIDYSFGQSRRYMWKLDNMDQNWVGPTTEHIANYTNLPPNEYTFSVRYLDKNNRVLDERKIDITVKPPFWETIWARIIFVLIIIILTYMAYRYAEQQMKKKQSEEKIKFFINTAHDIRTPLTLINGPIFELKESIDSNKKNDYLLKLITDNLNKLNKMFSQLLDFQKAYESQDQLVIRERSVGKYLCERLPYWKSSAAGKSISISLQLPEEEVTEWFDIEKVDKVLDNLISNAIKYTPERGEVVIKLATNTNHWRITVIDNGIGISKQERSNLFQRFYRASNAVNSQVTGSGLGLLLVKKYMMLHKGDVGFTSIENKGSEFYIEFKRGKNHYQNNILLDDNDIPILSESNTAGDVIDTGKLKIKLLIVEDNHDLRQYLQLSLNHYYNVYAAENGARAWESILKVNPDIVISDLQMPEMDGFELCEKIKSTFETSHIPVILLTVVNDKQHVVKGFNLGLDDYIKKPFDVKYLKLKVDNIIQNRKILRKKYLGIDKEQALSINKQEENSFNAEFIRKATEIIEANLTNPLFSITDFSKEMGMSRTLLFTKFNSITGYTPNDFIKTIRMNKAIVYFKEKKYSINEVALMVGFDEPAYFSTCFKKIYGKSPKQFIEENIK